MNAAVFNNIDGSVLDLNADITFANATGGLDDTDSDNIRVWNPATGGYTTFCLDGEENVWYDFDGQVEAEIPSGTAFWYLSRGSSAPAITTSGAVENANDCPIVLTAGKFNMIVNPYPVAYSLNDTDAVTYSGAVGGLDDTDSDNIRVWNPATGGYTTFCLDGEENVWYDFDGQVEPDIAANTPYWYLSRATGATSITFKKPF